MVRALLTSIVLLVIAPASAWAQYTPGFLWDRSADYTPGTVEGASDGNPNLDSAGSPVWEMGWVGYGGRLGEVDPWYEASITPSVHDANWYGGALSAWCAAPDTGAFIGEFGMQQGLNNSSGALLPIVRWVNPVSSPVQVDVEGTLQIEWDGFSTAPDTDVDVAIVHESAGGTFTPLFVTTFVKPTPGTSIEASPLVPVSVQGVALQPGDAIRISLQTRVQGLTADWIDLLDDLTIQIPGAPPVPSLSPIPATTLVLGLLAAGILASRSRRPGRTS